MPDGGLRLQRSTEWHAELTNSGQHAGEGQGRPARRELNIHPEPREKRVRLN